MFSLLYGIYKYATQKRKFNLLLLGIDAAGKTTFLEQIKTKFTTNKGLDPSSITPTIGLNVCKFVYSGCEITTWDLGGKGELKTIWQDYFKDCHALLYMVDVNCTERLQESFDSLVSALSHKDLDNIPVLILANIGKISASSASSTSTIEPSSTASPTPAPLQTSDPAAVTPSEPLHNTELPPSSSSSQEHQHAEQSSTNETKPGVANHSRTESSYENVSILSQPELFVTSTTIEITPVLPKAPAPLLSQKLDAFIRVFDMELLIEKAGRERNNKRSIFIKQIDAATCNGFDSCFSQIIQELKTNAREINEEDYI